MGITDTVKRLIAENRYIVHSYDTMHETALHWAAKRNLSEIVTMLLKAGAWPNPKDTLNRTPLYLACRENNFEVVEILLYAKAETYTRSQAGHFARDVVSDARIKSMLERAMLLEIMQKYVPFSKRNYVWENEGVRFFKSLKQ
jgi:ankyrin repeat protein